MAVPTIATVTPTTGWTGGQVIKIAGTNFRLPPTPPLIAGKLPPPIPTVEVKFGTQESVRVAVRSATLLEALAPIADPGAVDVTVTNLDDSGVAIPGETATSAGIFTYDRPRLTDRPDFDRVTRQLVIEMRRQVIENVSLFSHVDYDDVIGGNLDITHIGKLPAVALAGPDITEDRPFFADNSRREESLDADTFEAHRAPLTVQLEYEVLVLASLTSQLMALQTLVLQFFDRNRFLTLARDPTDLAKGTISFEMAWEVGATFRNTTRPNPSNVKSYIGNILIRGVIIEHLGTFPTETLDETSEVVDDVVTTTQAV